MAETSAHEERTGRAAFLVGIGIFTSRVAGLVRQSVFAHFFGASWAGDAFQTAFRIPNMLQNLFGEGVLSASFIPEYAGLLARKDEATARDVAGAVFAALALTASVVVLLGILTAPYLVDIIASGFQGEKRELTTTLVQVLFPGAALLVLSAWCLGILNSHRKFLLSYSAPLAWNVAMIAALVIFGPHRSQARLATVIAWASVIGSALQFGVQLPSVFRLGGKIRPHFRFYIEGAQRVFKQFTSAFLSRGVVQISALIDLALASHLPNGAPSVLAYAQTLYLLPGSLFGMSVAAAELPAMSSILGTADEVAVRLRRQLNAGMERITYFVVPCVVAFLALGDVIIAALFQTGKFHRTETIWVWEILAGSTIGLLASTLGRLDASTYYAIRDTRTPLNFAIMRIALTTILGIVFAFGFPRWFGLDPRLGAVGLTASAGIAGWVEFVMLRRGLTKRIGRTGLRVRYVLTLWAASLLAVGLAWLVRWVVPMTHRLGSAVLVLGVFGVAYLVFTNLFKVPEAVAMRAMLLAKLRRRSGVSSV